MRGLALLAVVSLSWASGAAAQAPYPDRVVRIIVPLAAGGGADILARLIADKLGGELGQQFIVENRAGGGTIIGTRAVASAPPDGYTLLVGQSSLAMTPGLNKSLPYDVMRDLTPIVSIAIGPNALMVHPKVPATTVSEFIAFAKASRDGVIFSSAGVGTPSHLAAELFRSLTGISYVHVPHKGMSPAILDLIAGNVQASFAGLPAAMAEARAGHVRLLGVAEKKRSALSPDVPTVAEAGLPEFDVGNWTGLLAPAGIDRAIVDKLNRTVIRILDTPAMASRLATLGFDRVDGTPEEFSARLARDLARWSEVIQRAGITVN
jgi:tripartite-type tricarboxylate transporter receptor subunit TctC